MPGWSKRDTTKAVPYKKGDVKIKHNLYDLVGANLLRAFQDGKITKAQLNDALKQISLEAKVDLGKGYGVGVGYNVPSANMRDNVRVKITKDIF
tara:strand:- start:135 stop:416 length:282 start_codon:yes stop_codon:yes gene_type:complete